MRDIGGRMKAKEEWASMIRDILQDAPAKLLTVAEIGFLNRALDTNEHSLTYLCQIANKVRRHYPLAFQRAGVPDEVLDIE